MCFVLLFVKDECMIELVSGCVHTVFSVLIIDIITNRNTHFCWIYRIHIHSCSKQHSITSHTLSLFLFVSPCVYVSLYSLTVCL